MTTLAHRVHIVRGREVGTLLRWLGDPRGRRLLDVAGGDGYWAMVAGRRGADAVAVDFDIPKLRRGTRLDGPAALAAADAHRLPFPDQSFDAVMSVCAVEHFADGPAAVDEMIRVLAPGGDLLLSTDALSGEHRWPELGARHRRRYHVVETYDAARLRQLLAGRGLEVVRSGHLFRPPSAQRLYLELSRHRLAWNVAAPLSPVVRLLDRFAGDDGGAVAVVHARRPSGPR